MNSEKPVYDEERGVTETEKGRKFFEMGTSSNSRSFEVESWAFVPHQNYSLQLMQKVKPSLDGDVIPAGVPELLAYFRTYTSTVGHSQFLPLMFYDFNRFMWNCVFNLIVKSLPLNYIIFFLSSYVPHELMIIHKMAPLMYGYNVLMILAILTLFSLTSESLMMVLYYAFYGVVKNAPWTRDAIGFAYKYKSEATQIRTAVILLIILAVIALCRKQIYKRTIWQVIKYVNWILVLFYLGALLHIFIFALETKLVGIQPEAFIFRSFQNLDYEMLADALGSPPLLHFLASRSNHQINPAEDSAILVFSNSLHYIMKGVVLKMFQRYTEHQYKVSFVKISVPNASFIYWPLYLSLVPFGDFIGCAFFLLQGISEFLIYIIAYNIALECIQCAFPKLKWWLMLVVTLPYVMIFRLKFMKFESMRRLLTYALVKGSVALAEILIIVCLYPIARLEDDIAFHTGSSPPKLISFAIRLTPVYFGIKLYLILSAEYELYITMGDRGAELIKYFMRFGASIVGILLIGILYPVIKNLCIKKQNWRSLIRPVPQWGPKDHIQRQLRKQYDSREYIGSTASRYLSRYLKSKLTSRMYRLDVCYETDKSRRHSTVAPQYDSVRIDDETKKDV